MSALSHGVDVVTVARLRAACERNPAFLTTAFTEEERRHCLAAAEPFARLAGRFAAKEACLKALGVGILEPTTAASSFAEIEVRTQSGGAPVLALSGWIASLARRRGAARPSVSISCAGALAFAIVVLEPDAAPES